MKIEVLFPLSGNLYGDLFNVKYLAKCDESIELVQTNFFETPAFVNGDIDLVYMGPMSESAQERAIESLLPYKEIIEKQIDDGKVFLFTGNALEVLCDYIEEDGKARINGVGIFPFTAKRRMMNRHNSNFLGDFEGMEIVGFKSQFTMLYGDNSNCYFSKALRGVGINKESFFEGIKKNNFFGTYLIGPLLVLNPDFTKYLLRLCGSAVSKLAFEEEVYKAYRKRVEEFKRVPFE